MTRLRNALQKRKERKDSTILKNLFDKKEMYLRGEFKQCEINIFFNVPSPGLVQKRVLRALGYRPHSSVG